MQNSLAQTLDQLHDFYAMAGTASATLVGLLFVGLSLRTGVDASRYDHALGVWALAQVTFTCFLDILLMALLFVVPETAPLELGLSLLALGLLAGAVTIGGGVRMRRAWSRTVSVAVWLPLGCYLVQIGVAITISMSCVEGLHWLVLVVVVLLLNAAYICWGLLRNPILDRMKPFTSGGGEGPAT